MCHCIIFIINISQVCNIIIDHSVSATVNGRELVYGQNPLEKCFFQLLATLQLPGSKGYDIQVVVHSATHKSDVSLAR